MDISKLWAEFLTTFETGWPRASELALAALANPWARGLCLMIAVYLTIRVIAAVYSGDKQKAELGPVAIRAHASGRYSENAIRLSRELMEMGMDGVSADCRVVYAYTDAKGRRRRRTIHRLRNIRLSVSPSKIRRMGEKIDGQEIPDVETRRVCFPPFESKEPLESVPATPERARDYALLHDILGQWHDDDAAPLISTGQEFMDQVAAGKTDFIKTQTAKIERAEKAFWGRRLTFRRHYLNRPNVVGSYYLKFEFSHEPLFVLTRHPDRDLKMTAWLTILTSMFALIMDWWPNNAPPFFLVSPAAAAASAAEHPPARTIRVP